MKSQKKWLLVMLALAMMALACGLGERAQQSIEEAADDVAAKTEEVVQEVQEQSEAVVEEAMENADVTTEDVQETVEEVVEEVTEKTEEVMEEANAAAENATNGETEEVDLQVTDIQGTLTTFSSYRSRFSVEFEGVDNQGVSDSGKINVLIEYIKEPEALHLNMMMEGDTVAELGGSAEIEMYNVDQMMYMQNPEDGSWFAFPSEGTDEVFSQGFFAPDDLVDLPENARCSILPENVNGISTRKCSFDENDIEDPDFTLNEAEGTVWIARDGDYPVKIEFTAQGESLGGDGSEFFQSGTFVMEYELLETNTSFDITPPEEALNATGLGDFMDSTDPGDIDLPMLGDAEVDFAMQGLLSYSSASNLDDAWTFYQNELPAAGWTLDPDSEVVTSEGVIAQFTKDGQTLSLIMGNEQDGKISIVLSTEQ